MDPPESVGVHERQPVRPRKREAELRRVDDGEPEARDEREPQVVGRADVGGVGHAQQQHLALEEPDRDRPVPVRELFREERDRVRVRRCLVEIDELELVLLREGDRDLPFAGEAEGDDDLSEPLARLLLHAERVLELLVAQQASRREQRAERGPAKLDVSRVQCVLLVAQGCSFVIGM